MFGKITIADKEYEMNANAATAIRYRGVFRKDLLAVMASLDMESPDVSIATDLASEMAYIMNQSALKADMTRLSFEGYVEWLEEIEDPMAFTNCAVDVINFYLSSFDTTSEAKKKTEE